MPQASSDLEELLRAVEPLPDPVPSPALVVISGLPGTGKSFFAKKLFQLVPAVLLESDNLRKLLFPKPTYSIEESARLFKAIYELIDILLDKNCNVMLDATNLEERHRERLYSIAEHRGAKLVLVRTEAPAAVVQNRLKNRVLNPDEKSDADWEVYKKMKKRVEPLSRKHFVVDTSRDITPVLNKVAKEVMKGV